MPILTVRGVLGAAAVMLGCSAALAGNNNTLRIEQDNTLGIIGNSLRVDQSGADNSIVGGALVDSNDPNRLTLTDTALQKGDGNTAKVTIIDDTGQSGGTAGLFQDSSGGVGGNDATIAVKNGGLGLVQQIGQKNVATLNVEGPLTKGGIYQNGNENDAKLTVQGTGAQGAVFQNGNGNSTDLSVQGTGTSVNYTLNGNNVTTQVPGGVQVFSNGATVTITQTHF